MKTKSITLTIYKLSSFSGKQVQINEQKFDRSNPIQKANKWIKKNIFDCDILKLIKEKPSAPRYSGDWEWWILHTK